MLCAGGGVGVECAGGDSLDRNGLRTKSKFEGGRDGPEPTKATDQKQVWRTGRDPQDLDDDDLLLSRKRDPQENNKKQTIYLIRPVADGNANLLNISFHFHATVARCR